MQIIPRLQPPSTFETPPAHLTVEELARWLADRESSVPGLIDGAEATIRFARVDDAGVTPICFLYIHGFSATWRETHPVTERLADAFGANVLQARLSGHGTDPETMVTPAEDWVASLATSFEVASRLGERVVVVATSTGAPLAVWLTSRSEFRHKLHALLFMSPNFGIRSPFGFLLTWPFSRYWMHLLVGREREWEPVNAEQEKYWSYRYSTLALIEMQKAVDWAVKQPLEHIETPAAFMLMKNDPTINPDKAEKACARWGAFHKALIEVTLDGDAPDHVFAGDITAPHRTDWVVEQFTRFLNSIS